MQLVAQGCGESLLSSGLLVPMQATLPMIELDDTEHELEADIARGGYQFFCMDRGWVNIPEFECREYGLNVRAFYAWLREVFRLSPPEFFPNSNDDIVSLGVARIGEHDCHVVWTPTLNAYVSVQQLTTCLQRIRAPHTHAVVLTPGPIDADIIQLLGPAAVVPLMEFFDDDVTINSDMLSPMLRLSIQQQLKIDVDDRPAVSCSQDGSALTVHGKTWTFRGFTQRRIIRQLFEASLAGSPRLRTAVVLENAESKAKTIGQAFSGYREDWRFLIHYGNGLCWLNEEARPACAQA